MQKGILSLDDWGKPAHLGLELGVFGLRQSQGGNDAGQPLQNRVVLLPNNVGQCKMQMIAKFGSDCDCDLD